LKIRCSGYVDVAPAGAMYRPEPPTQYATPDELYAATAWMLPVPPVAHVAHSVAAPVESRRKMDLGVEALGAVEPGAICAHGMYTDEPSNDVEIRFQYAFVVSVPTQPPGVPVGSAQLWRLAPDDGLSSSR